MGSVGVGLRFDLSGNPTGSTVTGALLIWTGHSVNTIWWLFHTSFGRRLSAVAPDNFLDECATETGPECECFPPARWTADLRV